MPNCWGWIDGADNTLGVQGGWYPFGDQYPGPYFAKCTLVGMHAPADCSVVHSPDPSPGGGFPQTEPGTMCTSGETAQILPCIAGMETAGCPRTGRRVRSVLRQPHAQAVIQAQLRRSNCRPTLAGQRRPGRPDRGDPCLRLINRYDDHHSTRSSETSPMGSLRKSAHVAGGHDPVGIGLGSRRPSLDFHRWVFCDCRLVDISGGHRTGSVHRTNRTVSRIGADMNSMRRAAA